jgi:DNA-binding response OmpR family regulator
MVYYRGPVAPVGHGLVELPVAAYLVKPVVFSDLLPRIQTAVTRSVPIRPCRARSSGCRNGARTEDLSGRKATRRRPRRVSMCSSPSRCGT